MSEKRKKYDREFREGAVRIVEETKGLQRNNPSFRVSCCHHGGMSVVEGLEASLAAKFSVVFPHLDERQRRLVMRAEARAIGHGVALPPDRGHGVMRLLDLPRSGCGVASRRPRG